VLVRSLRSDRSPADHHDDADNASAVDDRGVRFGIHDHG
jgi:hypothetical protein